MKHKASSRNLPGTTECARTRLAQGEVGAVDVCECGMVQVHIGTVTVRMDPRAFSELTATLCRADATYTVLQRGDRGEPDVGLSVPRHKRGQA